MRARLERGSDICSTQETHDCESVLISRPGVFNCGLTTHRPCTFADALCSCAPSCCWRRGHMPTRRPNLTRSIARCCPLWKRTVSRPTPPSRVGLGPRLIAATLPQPSLTASKRTTARGPLRLDTHTYAVTLTNLVAVYPPEADLATTDALGLGAHYDSREFADLESTNELPVPGANDGGSGVGAVGELMRIIPSMNLDHAVVVVLFDAGIKARTPTRAGLKEPPLGGQFDRGRSESPEGVHFARHDRGRRPELQHFLKR